MNCKLYQKQLVKYLDGELPSELAMQLQEHISKCSTCSNMLEQLQSIDKAVEDEKNGFIQNPLLTQRVMINLNKVAIDPDESRFSIRYITIATLAAAGLAIGILIGTLFTSSTSSLNDSSSASVYEQLADEYIPEVDNNPYNQIVTETEKTTKP